jgi:hypothetical protein
MCLLLWWFTWQGKFGAGICAKEVRQQSQKKKKKKNSIELPYG